MCREVSQVEAGARRARMKRAYREAKHTGKVTCAGCERATAPVLRAFRCFYCGLYFVCNVCAAEHFGGTREDGDRTIMEPDVG